MRVRQKGIGATAFHNSAPMITVEPWPVEVRLDGIQGCASLLVKLVPATGMELWGCFSVHRFGWLF